MPEATIDRRDLLPRLFPEPGRYLMVSGLAGASRDASVLTSEAEYLYTMGGAMGAAVSIGLGMALSAPQSEIAVITGDGELLMNVGALATVASTAPRNMTIVCIDNGLHGETGGQKGHTARRTDLAKMAQGAGLASVMTVSQPQELEGAARFLVESTAPRFLLAKVLPGPPGDWKRDWNLADCRLRFRRAYLERQDGGGA